MKREKLKLYKNFTSVFSGHVSEDDNLDDPRRVAQLSLTLVTELVLRYFLSDTSGTDSADKILNDIKYYIIDIYFNLGKAQSPQDQLDNILDVFKSLFLVYYIKDNPMSPVDISSEMSKFKDMDIPCPICLLELKVKIDEKVYTWYTISYSGDIKQGLYNDDRKQQSHEARKSAIKALDLWDANIDIPLYSFPFMVKKVYIISYLPLNTN